MYTTRYVFLQPDFPVLFFNSWPYVHHQYADDAISISLCDKYDNCKALVTFCIKDHTLYAPYRAPFGGIEFDENLSDDDISVLLKEIDTLTKQHNLLSIRLALPPLCYNEKKIIRLKSLLEKHGYEIAITDINYHIPISDKEFEHIISRSERGELIQCRKMSFRCVLEQHPDLDKVYALISENRKFRGIPLNITSVQFKNCFFKFPGQYNQFNVYNEQELIATATVVQVNQDALYYFLPAYHEKYKTFSPGIMALEKIYEYAQAHQYKIFDLGIATDKGIPNEGLMQFKRKLGGIESEKWIMEKKVK